MAHSNQEVTLVTSKLSCMLKSNSQIIAKSLPSVLQRLRNCFKSVTDYRDMKTECMILNRILNCRVEKITL